MSDKSYYRKQIEPVIEALKATPEYKGSIQVNGNCKATKHLAISAEKMEKLILLLEEPEEDGA